MKTLLIILTFLVGTISNALTEHLDLIINPEYKGNIAIYDKPNGKVIATVKHDFENEDFLIFSVSDQTSDFFYGIVAYSISGEEVKGWVKKENYIGTYARNYEPKTPLKLYSEAKLKAKVKATVTERTNQFYQVTAFDNGWVYVKEAGKGEVKQGWLSPEMQCANPYSTCN